MTCNRRTSSSSTTKTTTTTTNPWIFLGAFILGAIFVLVALAIILRMAVDRVFDRVESYASQAYSLFAELADISRTAFENLSLPDFPSLTNLSTSSGKEFLASCIEASVNEHFGSDYQLPSNLERREYAGDLVLWLSCPEYDIFAVRGTLTSDDAQTCLQAFQQVVRDLMGGQIPGKVHKGFANRFYKLLPDLSEISQYLDKTTKPVVFTGHSLGGAIACLMAMYYAPRLEPGKCQLTTFGMPKIGDSELLSYLNKLTNFDQIANLSDIVTQLPTSVFPDTHGNWFYSFGQRIEFIDFQTGSSLGNHSLENYRGYFYDKIGEIIN